MDKETLIREIQDVLGIDAPIFYKIKLLLNEYQRLSITGDVQELCLLARIQTELELLLIGGNKFADPPSRPKIQTALNHVLQKKQHLLTPVEKKIHFVWIGTLGSFQIAYMKTWAYYNPDYEIQLWHDPHALLSGILRQKIKLYAGTLQGIGNDIDIESTASIHVRAIIDLQNEFYKDYFLPGMRQQQTFDDCATQFLLAKGWSTTDQLDEIKSTHAYSFDQAINALNVARSRATQAQPKMPIRLVEINATLFQNTAKKDYYKYYLKELGLRQNSASASDKVRYMILYKEGGIYLDVDLLPHPDNRLWQKIKTDLFDNISKRKIINDHYPQNEFSYMRGVFWFYLADVLESIFTGKALALEENTYHRQAYVEMMLMNSLLRACNDDSLLPLPSYQQLALDINQGNQDPFFKTVQLLSPEINHIVESLSKDSLMIPLGELHVLPDGIGYIKHPYVEGEITNSCLFASKDSLAMLEILNIVLQRDIKIELHQIDRLDVSRPPGPSSDKYSTLDINLMMYRYDGWIEGAVATVYSSGPKIIVAWLAEYEKKFSASHPELTAYFEVFKQQFFVFTHISYNTEENLQSTWIGSAMMSRDHYYEKPSRYQSQLIIQFDNQPSTEAAAHWLYNKRKEISIWVKIVQSGRQERIMINGTIPQGFQFYDNQADKKARILLIGQGYNKQLSGLSGEDVAQKIINVLASQVLKNCIDRNLVPGDQTPDVISRIHVVASDIEPVKSHSPSSSNGWNSSLSRGFTYQLLAHLRKSRIEIYEGVAVCDAIIGVDVVGRKWVGSWDVLSEKILWRSSQEAYKWVGVLTPSGNAVKFGKTLLEKDILTQIRPWIDINKHGRFGLFSVYAFSDGLLPAKMSDLFCEPDFIHLADQFGNIAGHRILMADVSALFSGMKRGELSGGIKIRTAIVDDRADQLRILRDILRQVIFNEKPEQWLAWLASSNLVLDKTQQRLQALLISHPEYYASLKTSVDEDLFDFYYMDLAQKNAYYPIINYLGSEAKNIKVIYLGYMERRLSILFKKKVFDTPILDSSLEYFEENVLKLSGDHTFFIYYTAQNTNRKSTGIEVFQSDLRNIASELIPVTGRKKTIPLAESYLNSALIFENLTKEIALLGRAVPEGSLVLLQKVTPVSGRNTFRVPFLNPKTGVLIEIETEQTIFKQVRDSLEKSYRIPLSNEDNLALAVNHYHSRVALDLSSWLFNKIFVARFLIEQIKSGKGLFAMPDTRGLPNKFGQSLALQHYVGVVGMASDLLDDAARLSYFTLSRVVSVQAVEFSLHRIAYFSAELLSGTTETSRYAFLIKGILQKDHIQHVVKKLVNGISKTFMGLGLILSATDIVLTTSALLNAPNSDAQMILGIQLGFSVLGFGLQLFAIGAALLGATSLALALGTAVLVVAIIGVVIIFLLEHFQQKINTIKASAQFFKNLKKSWKQGYVLKQGCFIHEGPASITLLELGVLGRAFRIAFGTQRYQAYGSTFIGGIQSELRKLNVLKPFHRADVSVTELPPNNEQDDILTHNLVLPCVAQTDYDFSYDRGVAKIEEYGSSEAFAPLRELEKENKDFVFFHKRHINDVPRGMARSIYYEMQEIIPTKKLTNIWVTISENQFVQNQWALHFPWAKTKEDYSQEYTVFKKENPDWEKFGSGYEQFKEKITATEQAFRQDIIDNASEITYHMDNTSNLCQILVLPPVAFPLKLHLQGGNWLISALTLGVITLPSRKNTQLQIGGHEIELMLTADESIQIQCLIHEKVTLIQNITASEMNIASIVFDASESPANSLKAELNLLYEQQIKTLSDADRLPSLLIKNYQAETYQGNAHYVTKNGAILWVPAFAAFKFSIACARLLTIEAEKVFFYAHIDLNTQTNGKLKTRESPFQPTFWITHSRSSLLEFVNYSFLPLFTSSTGLKIRVKITQVGEQLTLIEHFKKGASSVAVHYAINITPTAHNPLLLRKIQCSSDIFSVLVQNELFFGERSSQTTLKQLRGLLCTMLLDIYLLDDYPDNHNPLNKKSSGGKIYADEIIQITDNENTEAYWWSRSCGILAPITLPTGKQEKIKPIWSGRNDYQRVSFWMSTGNQTPVDNENEEGKLYIKHDTEPYIDYSKLGLLKHVGHTPERLYTEDTQGNIYAIDVSGRAYLSTIGSRWLTNHQDDLSTAFTALLALNDNEADERFHLPVLGIEGFLCGVSTHNTKSLQTWYETHLKRFYFYYSSHGQKLHYLTHDTQEKAAFWDPHNKNLLYISSIALDEVQTFNPVIPENRLPPVEIVLYGVQKAWKNEELLYLENNQLIFFSDFKQSPYHFSLQGIAEGYISPYLLSYQLASALKKEFYRVFSDENRAYPCDHYAIWQTHIPNTPPGAQDLFTINFTERKTQIWKMLIEKIVKRTPECLSVTPKNMWSFLAAHLAQLLPKARLHVDDINNMIREAFIAIRKSGACNIELKPKRLLRFSQYGWYNTQLSALFMIPKERDKHVDYQYLGLSRDGYHSYVSAEEKRVYKISGLQEWEMAEDWPAGWQKIADLLCIKRFGDELIYIEKKSTLSGLQKNLAFSAYFLADIKEIKTLYPRQKSATLLIQLQNWSAITFVIQAHNRAFEEDVELIIEKEDLGTYKVQREEQDLWIFQTQRKFALCVSNVLNTEPVPEDIDLKVVNESITMTIPLSQLIEKYNHQADQPETFYDEVVYPIYILSDLLNSPP